MPAPTANDPSPKGSLTERTATGVMWGAGGALVYQVFALFVQTALTYLLTKAQYGGYGKAFAALGFAMLLQQVGFNEILLRRGKRWRLWASAAFWCALFLGLSGTVLLLALAYPLGRLYDDRELTVLLLLMAPTPLIRSLLVLPSAQLIESMRFRLHYGLMLVNALIISSATLGFAAMGFGAKAFAAGPLLAEPIYVVIIWRLAGCHVSSGPRPSRWWPLAKDFKFMFGSNAARWMRTSIDPLILGLFAPASAVGVYFFGQSMVGQIVRVVTLNLSGVLLPALNKLAQDPERQKSAFLRAARVLTLVGAPLCVGLAATGSLFVRVFLEPEKWAGLPPVLSVLALGVVFRLLDEPVQSLISAQGRFKLGFRLALSTAAVYAMVCTVGSISGNPLSVAVTIACYYSIVGPTLLYLAIRIHGGTWSEALRVFWTPLLVALAAIVPWLLLDRWAPGQGRTRDAFVLAGVVAGSFGSYLLLGRSLKPAGWRELVDRAQRMVPNRLGRLLARIGGVPLPA